MAEYCPLADICTLNKKSSEKAFVHQLATYDSLAKKPRLKSKDESDLMIFLIINISDYMSAEMHFV